jgi:hypothetical protein
VAELTFCGPAYCKDLNNAPVIRGIQLNMDKKLTPPVVAVEKMPDGLFIHFADGRVAFYSYDLLYATIETAQIVTPEMNDTIDLSLEDEWVYGYVRGIDETGR